MGLATGTPGDVAAAPAVSVDCFGTLVDAGREGAPWDAVAAALADRGVAVPEDWEAAYRTSHRDLARLEDRPLGTHVHDALAASGVACDPETARAAVFDAFDVPVTVRPGARALLERLSVPVAVVSNCSVAGLVDRALERAEMADEVDAVVTSVDCGRLKPHHRPFEAAAEVLDVPLATLVHVGDEAGPDGAAESAGATALVLRDEGSGDLDLLDIAATLEGSPCR